jgi:hypothetical protein
MKIQISESTKVLISKNNKFKTIKRDQIEIKGKGLMNTYFVELNYQIAVHNPFKMFLTNQLKRPFSTVFHSHQNSQK